MKGQEKNLGLSLASLCFGRQRQDRRTRVRVVDTRTISEIESTSKFVLLIQHTTTVSEKYYNYFARRELPMED